MERTMEKIYYIEMEDKDIVAAIDEEDNVKYLLQNEDFPLNPDREQAEAFLRTLSPDDSWYEDIDECQLYDLLSTEDVLAEIEQEIQP